MAEVYEVFDSDAVLYVLRRRSTQLLFVLLFSTVIFVALICAYVAGSGRTVVLLPTGVFGFTVLCVVLAYQYSRLRSTVWCLKISDREIGGYDFARNKTVVDWIRVKFVEVTDKGLQIHLADRAVIEILDLFQDYPRISHLVVSTAEIYDVPVLIEGRKWSDLDVHTLYPFIREDETSVS